MGGKPIDVQRIMALPKNDKQRKMVEEIANKVSALIRGHLTRCRFKKLYFLHQVTGKIAH